MLRSVKMKEVFFGRAWCHKELISHGLNANVVQTNVSYSKNRGTLRGMHYQVRPYSESKVVLCTAGAIYDVIIDLRPESNTYKQWIGVELTAESFRMLYVPEGFAHGFITLEDHSSVHYMVTEYYTAEAERGIRFDDPQININWPIVPLFISEKDKSHPPFMVSSPKKAQSLVL
jgi:dTDP-4-dehydrorhamnose 3,5-epimerase